MTSQFVVGQSAIIFSASTQRIASVNLSNSTYAPFTANGVVGTVSVTMSPGSPAPSGMLSISGVNSGGFYLTSTAPNAQLLENSAGTTGAGPYSDFQIVYTEATISNSPFSITPMVEATAQTIASVNLSPTTYTAGVANGTVGTVSVAMNPASPAFSGSMTVTGENAGGFYLSGSRLLENPGGTTGAGPYSDFNIVATQGGISNSPQQITPTVAQGATFPVQFTIVNSGGSTQAAGAAMQPFGMPFRDGDMTPSQVPVFTVSGTPQPFSYGLRSYWPSGNLKFVSIMLAPTFSLGAGASTTCTCSAVTGSWPTASGRTLTEVYNQQLVVNAPSLSLAGQSTGIGGNRSTQVSAWLYPNTDPNIYKVVQWMDGQAGAAWRISTNMAATHGGTADAFLKFDHYVFALGAGGSPLGFRWLGRMRMPNYAACTTANNNFFCAPPNSGSPTSGLNWQINPGGSGVITNLPPWGLAAATDMTATSGQSTMASTAANAWWTGPGSDGNIIPVQLSGSPPTPWVAGDCWWGLCDGQGDFTIYSAPNCSDTSQTPAANATFTATPVVGFCPFTSIGFATANAKYNFFQGTGSQAAETTLRMQINQTYWQSSRLIPTINIALSGSAFGGVISDTTYPFDWRPYSIGPISQAVSQAGDSPFIGALKSYDFVDFYNQSVLSEKQVRICGLAGFSMLYDLKDPTLDTVVNVSSNTYTGLPASDISIGWGGRGGTPATGFTSPGPGGNASSLGMDGPDASHMPNFSYWPYIRTGELQYFDNMAEVALGSALLNEPNRNPRAANGDSPYDVDGCVTYAVQQARGEGWALRNLECTAIVAPWNPTTPSVADFDGTQRSKYFNDLADIAEAFLWDQWSDNPSGIFSSYAISASIWTQYNYNAYDGGPAYISNPYWEMCYVGLAACYGAARGNAKALLFLNLLGARAAYIGSTYGFYVLYAYQQQIGPVLPGYALYALTPSLITEDAQYVTTQLTDIQGTPSGGGAYLYWNPNSGGTINGFFLTAAPGNNYVPADNDVIIPDAYDGAGPPFYPSELNTTGPYFIVGYNPSPGAGNYASFNLSNTLGGSPISLASTSGCSFTASISGTTMTVSAISLGQLYGGAIIQTAAGVTAGTKIQSQLTGSPGSTGTYSLNNSQTVGSEAMTIFPGDMVFNYCTSKPNSPPLGVGDSANFLYQVQECAKWATALGATGWGTTIADCDYRNTNSDFSASPNYYYNEPGYNPIDARYCVQDTFG